MWLGPQATSATIVSLPSWSSSPSNSTSSLSEESDDKPTGGTTATRFVKDTRRDKPRQPLACFFCRARKIACQRPLDPNEPDQSCAQCRKRQGECEYPTKSRRGLYARIPPETPRKPRAAKGKRAHS
ncbi:hypothetical protein FB45DRAFT_937290 [Roridomyces roridus]|uniref:Zn(2)-C6 fungal-type domain-containing protein n=1 Tax=Roridomyces roridus TaxID=1738132 RepID=A0AAD7B827_9AGAR|nr:hypothetical protein FB45DRAFT_938584 [Roridomyces roridus]KAJ7614572.1 hypothetical protein FB45DRAFT_937290 [Roridomyces roridus]